MGDGLVPRAVLEWVAPCPGIHGSPGAQRPCPLWGAWATARLGLVREWVTGTLEFPWL